MMKQGRLGYNSSNGRYGLLSSDLWIEHDLYYIENWTLSFDIKILFLTVFKGFVNKNAY